MMELLLHGLKKFYTHAKTKEDIKTQKTKKESVGTFFSFKFGSHSQTYTKQKVGCSTKIFISREYRRISFNLSGRYTKKMFFEYIFLFYFFDSLQNFFVQKRDTSHGNLKKLLFDFSKHGYFLQNITYWEVIPLTQILNCYFF